MNLQDTSFLDIEHEECTCDQCGYCWSLGSICFLTKFYSCQACDKRFYHHRGCYIRHQLLEHPKDCLHCKKRLTDYPYYWCQKCNVKQFHLNCVSHHLLDVHIQPQLDELKDLLGYLPGGEKMKEAQIHFEAKNYQTINND